MSTATPIITEITAPPLPPTGQIRSLKDVFEEDPRLP